MKEATENLIETAGNYKSFEVMQCNVKNKAVFSICVNICLARFCSSMNLRYTVYNTIVSDMIIESDEAFAMLSLENNVDDYK